MIIEKASDGQYLWSVIIKVMINIRMYAPSESTFTEHWYITTVTMETIHETKTLHAHETEMQRSKSLTMSA